MNDKEKSKHWDSGYVCLPNNFGDDVKGETFKILFKIMTFQNYDQDKRLSQKYITQIANVSKSTSKRGLKELQDKGYIVKTKEFNAKENSPAEYEINKQFVMRLENIEKETVPSSQNEHRACSQNEQRPVVKMSTKKVNSKKVNRSTQAAVKAVIDVAPHNELSRHFDSEIIEWLSKASKGGDPNRGIKRLIAEYDIEWHSEMIEKAYIFDLSRSPSKRCKVPALYLMNWLKREGIQSKSKTKKQDAIGAKLIAMSKRRSKNE